MKTNGSYLGKICLLQIATRSQIYIVDTLQPEVPAALEDLNRVTTDPKILKVYTAAVYLSLPVSVAVDDNAAFVSLPLPNVFFGGHYLLRHAESCGACQYLCRLT